MNEDRSKFAHFLIVGIVFQAGLYGFGTVVDTGRHERSEKPFSGTA